MVGRRRAVGRERWFPVKWATCVVVLLLSGCGARATEDALPKQRHDRVHNRRMLQQPPPTGTTGTTGTTWTTGTTSETMPPAAGPMRMVALAQDGGQNVFSQERCTMQLLYKSTVTRGNGAFYVSGFAFGEVGPTVNVTSWKLGVALEGDNTVRDQDEVLGTDGQVFLEQNGTRAVFSSSSPSFYVNPSTSPVSFGFVESLGPNSTVPRPAKDVVFNNLKCTVGRTVGQLERLSDSPSPPVEIEYAPLELKNGTSPNTLFSFRIRNIQVESTIKLQDLKILYYFHGFYDPPTAIFDAPYLFFNASCVDKPPDMSCNGVNVAVVPAYENVSDAQFAVEVTFDEGSRQLQPAGKDEEDVFNPDGNMQESEVAFFIQLDRVFGANGIVLDAPRDDYSFLDTPLSGQSVSDTYDIRKYAQNEKMVVFYDLDGEDILIWGIPPGPVPDVQVYSYTCENEASGICQFQAEYCCEPVDPCEDDVTDQPPPGWTYDGVLREAAALEGTQAERCPALPVGSDGASDGGDGITGGLLTPAASSSSSSTTWIIGVVCGVTVVIITSVPAIWFLRRKRRASRIKAMGNSDLFIPSKEDWEPPDARELPWYVSIHVRLGGEEWTDSSHLRRVSDLTTEPSGTSPLSSQRSSFQASNGALTVEPRAIHANRGLGSNSRTSRSNDRLGTPCTEPQSPMSPKRFKFVRIVPGYSGVAPIPPEAESLIFSKCTTMSGRFSPYVSRALEEKRSIEFEDLEEGRDDGDSEGEESSSFDIIEDWQLMRRAKSWDGMLTVPEMDLDSEHAALRIRRLKRRDCDATNASPLPPPMSQLNIPMIGDDVVPSIDLHIPAALIERTLTQCIGSGGFGSVYLGTFKGREVAVKKLPPFVELNSGNSERQSAYEALIREISLASRFASERLVRVYGACTDDRNKCCLIMELMKGGNLYQRIHDKKRRRMTYIEILQVAHDIAEGLAYLHPIVIHRDLKPQNILLDQEGRAKIADFGISKVKDPQKSYLTRMTAENGTPMYMSPEQMNGSKVDEKVDTYALGCIMNEMWTRRQPWRESNHFFQIILKVAVNGDRPWMDPETPNGYARLIKKCWHQDPHQRPSCADVLRRLDFLIRDELERWDRYAVTRKSSATSLSSAGGTTLGKRSPESVRSLLASPFLSDTAGSSF